MGKRDYLKGAIHLHTTLSHDGDMSFEELTDFLKYKGYDFIIITEHSYDMNEEKVNILKEQADALSTSSFLIIPGLEFRCHSDIDILGIGVTDMCESDEPGKVIDHIHSRDGIAVLAHPTKEKYPIENEWVARLDGCEIYNNGNDGKYIPRANSIKKFRILQVVNPNLKAYSALDLHRRTSYSYSAIKIDGIENSRQSIMNALKIGDFVTQSHLFMINSSGGFDILTAFNIRVLGFLLNTLRWLRNGLLPG